LLDPLFFMSEKRKENERDFCSFSLSRLLSIVFSSLR
jgi:hypothetical protein